MDDVTFCTLTNNGYVDYTLNCLESLKRIGLNNKLEVYCSDKQSFNKIKPHHEGTHYFEQSIIDTDDKQMIVFGKDGFGETMKLKLMVIHHCLKKSKYVLFTDGDIFYHKAGFIEYLLENIGDHNILIQNDKIEGHVSMGDRKPVCCAGFMFIKQTEETLKMYDVETTDPFFRGLLTTSKRGDNFDDQIYLRRLRNEHNDRIKMHIIPSYLFPTYYVVKRRLIPKNWDEKYLLHYNYLTGDDKRKTMIGDKCWII
jgi:hypothetical protein